MSVYVCTYVCMRYVCTFIGMYVRMYVHICTLLLINPALLYQGFGSRALECPSGSSKTLRGPSTVEVFGL